MVGRTAGKMVGAERVEVVTGVFALNERNEVLFVHGSKFPDWVIPGGHINTGETIVQCARREMLEETGMDCGNLAVFGVNEDTQRIIRGEARHFVYVNLACRVKKPVVTLDGAELTEFEWIPLEKSFGEEKINEKLRSVVLPELIKFVERKLF